MKRILLMSLALALTAATAVGVAAAGDEPLSATPDRGAVELGQSVAVSGSGWEPGSRVSVSICGNQALRGSADCDLPGSRTIAADSAGAFRLEMTAAEPPAPCPCVVFVTGETTTNSIRYPIELIGVASAPVVPVELGAAQTIEIVDARLTGRGAWTGYFGASTDRQLVLTVANRGAAPEQPDVAVTWGTSATPTHVVDVPEFAAIAPGEQAELVIDVPIDALTVGAVNVSGSVGGIGVRPAFVTSTSHYPWALFAVGLVAMQALLIAIRNRVRQRLHADVEEDEAAPPELLPTPALPVGAEASTTEESEARWFAAPADVDPPAHHEVPAPSMPSPTVASDTLAAAAFAPTPESGTGDGVHAGVEVDVDVPSDNGHRPFVADDVASIIARGLVPIITGADRGEPEPEPEPDAEPQHVDPAPERAEPESVEPVAVEPEVVEPQVIEPVVAEPDVAEPESVEAVVSALEIVEPEVVAAEPTPDEDEARAEDGGETSRLSTRLSAQFRHESDAAAAAHRTRAQELAQLLRARADDEIEQLRVAADMERQRLVDLSLATSEETDSLLRDADARLTEMVAAAEQHHDEALAVLETARSEARALIEAAESKATEVEHEVQAARDSTLETQKAMKRDAKRIRREVDVVIGLLETRLAELAPGVEREASYLHVQAEERIQGLLTAAHEDEAHLRAEARERMVAIVKRTAEQLVTQVFDDVDHAMVEDGDQGADVLLDLSDGAPDTPAAEATATSEEAVVDAKR